MTPKDHRSVPSGAHAPRADVEAFLQNARQAPAPSQQPGGRGRLIFALDATMSRQPTWDLAIRLQAGMFDAAEVLGGLDVQLVYFRGHSECKASRFVSGGAGLAKVMSAIRVAGGRTQIGRVLRHAREEARRNRISALVYVGDALEEELDLLCATAGELALVGTRAFMFHEGHDRTTGQGFRKIARLTGGAYAAFDAGAPARLAALLAAAAAYAAGGLAALQAQGAGRDNGEAQNLLSQLSKKTP